MDKDRQVKEYEILENGLWVSYIYNSNHFNGFILNSDANWANVQIVKINGLLVDLIINVPKQILWLDDDFINPDDISDMILLAKQTGDSEWENNLRKELSYWKSIEE